MLISKYLNKYYKKYFIYYLIGIIALVFVDFIQLYIPEFLGEAVGIFENASKMGTGFTEEMTSGIIRLTLLTVLIGFCMMVGRMAWRFTLFRASHKSKLIYDTICS